MAQARKQTEAPGAQGNTSAAACWPPPDLAQFLSRGPARLLPPNPTRETNLKVQTTKIRDRGMSMGQPPYRGQPSAPAQPWPTTLIWQADFHVGHPSQKTRPARLWAMMAMGSTGRWRVDFGGSPKPLPELRASSSQHPNPRSMRHAPCPMPQTTSCFHPWVNQPCGGFWPR